MTPVPTTDHGAERAARAIIELINSRPWSPRVDEIAAIIELTVVTPPPRTPSAPSISQELDEEYGPDISARHN